VKINSAHIITCEMALTFIDTSTGMCPDVAMPLLEQHHRDASGRETYFWV
jgi:hypothetical protein